MIVRLKGHNSALRTLYKDGFNSMIVRLKGGQGISLSLKCLRFQFYDSPIKRFRKIFKRKKELISFNSMIVRLKAVPQGVTLHIRKFQFYDSPIKRYVSSDFNTSFV